MAEEEVSEADVQFVEEGVLVMEAERTAIYGSSVGTA